MKKQKIPAEVQRAVRGGSGERITETKAVAGLVMDIVRRVAGSRANGLTLDTVISDMELDSLERIEILATIEEHFSSRFPEDLLPDLHTCRKVVEAVEIHLTGETKHQAVFEAGAETHVVLTRLGRKDLFPQPATPDHTSGRSALKSEDSSSLDFYQDDFLLDNTGAISITSVRDRLPAIDVRGATVINAGVAHTKAPRMIACPRCRNVLKEGTTVLRFRLAPEPTCTQQVEGWVCDCGEAYVPGVVAKEAHHRAFAGTSRTGDHLS